MNLTLPGPWAWPGAIALVGLVLICAIAFTAIDVWLPRRKRRRRNRKLHGNKTCAR